MLDVGSIQTFDQTWFDHKGPYAILKPEYREALKNAIAAQKKRDTAALEEFRAEEKSREPIELTDGQKAALSEKYDPEDMTREQYLGFVDELYEYGILEGNDRDYIEAGARPLGMMPLDWSTNGVQVSSMSWQNLHSFEDCAGNVLEWVRYQATFESFSEVTMDFEPTRRAILFGRISEVLDQIGD